DLINEIAEHIKYTPAQRLFRSTKSGMGRATEWTKGAVLGAPTSAQKTISLGREFAVELADIARDHGPALMKKGMEQAKAKVAQMPLASQVSSLFQKAS